LERGWSHRQGTPGDFGIPGFNRIEQCFARGHDRAPFPPSCFTDPFISNDEHAFLC
jgi:hypothetical protein